MTTPSTGLFKSTAAKLETTWNTAPSAASAQLYRRVRSAFALKADNYRSNEIRADRQIVDFRLGTRHSEGTIEGELAPGAYAAFMASMLGASAFTAGATTGALTNVTAAAGPPGTFTRAAGSFITDGFKVGDIVRWTGWTTTATNNNSRNYRITALTALIMTVGTAATGASGQPEIVAAKASGDSVTCTVVGKKLITPAAGSQIDSSFSIEHWFADNSFSELYTGCKVVGMDINLPASGLATVRFAFQGGGLTTAITQYFTSPLALSTEGITAAADGTLRINGSDVADVTALSISVKGGHTTEKVVGSQYTPGVFPGVLDISGSVSALFDSTANRDNFLNETSHALNAVLTVDSSIASDLLAFNLPKIKLTDSAKDDKAGAISGTYPFQALLNTAGGTGTTGDSTTLCIQDSNA